MVLVTLWKLAWRELMRARMQRTLRKDRPVPLAKALRLWSLTPDMIYQGPVGPSARYLPEAELYSRYSRSQTPVAEELLDLAGHRCPAVAGYALEILKARKSPSLMAMVERLQGRKELVAMGLTCLICYQPLEDYARTRGATPGEIETTPSST